MSPAEKPIRIVALGRFGAQLPAPAQRLVALGVELSGTGEPERLPALGPGDVLLTELDWLKSLSPESREELARLAAACAEWIALADPTTPFADLVAWQRLGVGHFLDRPLDPERLAELVEDIHERLAGPAPRVMLVEKDRALLDFHAEALRAAGMAVLATDDPARARAELTMHRPDLLITDMDLSCCRGNELATVLRKRPGFSSLPALYLVEEHEAGTVTAARGLAPEAYLPRTTPGELLAATAEAQAAHRRARQRNEAHWRNLESLSQSYLEQLRLALDQHAIVSIADTQGRIVFVNDKFCAISGYSREELIGQNHRLVKSGDHPPEFYETLWSTISSGKVWHGEIANRRKDGRRYWVEATIVPLLDRAGLPTQYISIRTDVTLLKEREDALRISDERLRRSQAFANIGTWDWNIQTGELYWSERIAPLFGYPTGELDTSYDNFLKAVHPDDRQTVVDAVNAAVERDVPYEIEHRVVWPDGQVRWLLERGAVVRDPTGAPLHMLGVVQDIHERKTTQAALAESERSLREAQSLARIGNWEADMITGRLTWSDEIFRIFGRDPANFAPSVEAFMGAVHPDDLALVRASEKKAEETGIHDVVHRIVLPDGRIRHVHELAHAKRDAAGRLIRLRGTVQDVTERIMAEKRLHDSEARFAFAVEGAGDGVWDWDIPSGKMLFSGNYEGMLGFAKGELEPNAEAWLQNVHPDDSARVQAHLQDYLAGKVSSYSVELRLRCKTGDYKWILCRGTVVERDASGKPKRMIGIHSDISAHKQAEESLRLFQRIFEASEQGVGVTDRDGYLLYSNPTHDRIHGYSHEQVIGSHFTLFLSEETRSWAVDAIMSSVQAGKTWSGKLPIMHPDGTEVVTLAHVGFVPDALGKPQFLFNIMSDYTSELVHQQQLSDAKEAAERANQAKSDFLSSMSHELRTPMNAILGFAQMLEYDDGLNADQLDSVHEILKAGHHLLELINEVLDLAKIESGRVDMSIEPVELDVLFDDCRHMIQPLAAARGIALDMVAPHGTAVRGDRVRLKQVLLNLLSNAVKYNRDGGSVRLAVQAGGENRLRIGVADTGPGIPPARIADLFQPFNRLDAENSGIEGTGIGLTITRRLVEMMGGEIGVESEVGKGSLFWIELPAESPASETQTAGTATQSDTAPQRHAAFNILCIDDNPANLKLFAQILGKRPNIHLITAHTPDLGIELALAHHPDLVLLDINMPVMDGYQVLEVFKADARLRHLPVAAVTANAMPRDIERGRAAGFAEYLTKPLDVGRFIEVIDRYRNTRPQEGVEP